MLPACPLRYKERSRHVSQRGTVRPHGFWTRKRLFVIAASGEPRSHGRLGPARSDGSREQSPILGRSFFGNWPAPKNRVDAVAPRRVDDRRKAQAQGKWCARTGRLQRKVAVRGNWVSHRARVRMPTRSYQPIGIGEPVADNFSRATIVRWIDVLRPKVADLLRRSLRRRHRVASWAGTASPSRPAEISTRRAGKQC